MGVCFQGVQICMCGIVSWKHVTVGVGRLKFEMAGGCVWSGVQLCKCGIC